MEADAEAEAVEGAASGLMSGGMESAASLAGLAGSRFGADEEAEGLEGSVPDGDDGEVVSACAGAIIPR